MKKFFMLVACATLICSGSLQAATHFMNEVYSVSEVQEEKKDEKKDDKKDVILVIELDAHTDILNPRMAAPVIGAGLTDASQLKVWSDMPVQAQVEITDETGMVIGLDVTTIAPGSPCVLSLAGVTEGLYRVYISLAGGATHSGSFVL